MSRYDSEDEEHLQTALEEARHALSDGELPVGTLIVIDRAVRFTGRKRPDGNWLLDHAEMCALKSAIEYVHRAQSNVTVYTTLEPCIMCFGTLVHCRVDRIVYALEDPYGGAMSLCCEHLPPRHRERHPLVEGGVMREESRALFTEFFRTTTEPFWQNRENPLVKLCLNDP